MSGSMWTWKCLSSDGETIARHAEEFPTRGDAESWLGESEAGADR